MTLTTDPAELQRRWMALQMTRAQHRMVSRQRLVMPTDFPSPGALAQRLDPTTVQTPALDLIDGVLVKVQRHMMGFNDGLSNVIISMSPQEGKSERITHYGAEWFLQQNPNLRIGLVSYGEEMVRRHSYAIRNDIVTNNGQEGNLDLGLRLRKDTKAAGRWNLNYPHQGGIYAVSIGGPFTGRPIDLLIIDDPVKDPKAAESAFMSQAAWDWWVAVARPRLAPGAPVILVLTRWHQLDLAGRLMAKQREDEASLLTEYDRWTVLNIPAKADHDPAKGEVDVLGREPGEYMVSARGRTTAQWQATEAATPPIFWLSLYQGRPNPEQGDVWMEDWWQWYTEPLWEQRTITAAGVGLAYHVPGPYAELIQSWDMAFKDKRSSDFVVGQVWLKRGADAYLLDQVQRRMTFTESVAAVRRMKDRWPQCSTILVEDKANGTAVIDSLKHEIPGLLPVNPTDSKYGRAVSVSPYVRSGNVYLPDKRVALPGGFDREAFLAESNAFPNGAHDDQVDTTSQALRYLYLDGNAITEVAVPEGRIPTRSTGTGMAALPPHMQRSLRRAGR